MASVDSGMEWGFVLLQFFSCCRASYQQPSAELEPEEPGYNEPTIKKELTPCTQNLAFYSGYK
jgi:hypothetical protein